LGASSTFAFIRVASNLTGSTGGFVATVSEVTAGKALLSDPAADFSGTNAGIPAFSFSGGAPGVCAPAGPALKRKRTTITT